MSRGIGQAGDIITVLTAGVEIDLQAEAGTAWEYATSILFLSDCAQFDCVFADGPTAGRSFTGVFAPKAGDVRHAKFTKILATTTSGVSLEIAYGETV